MKLSIFEYTYNKGLPGEWRVEECQFSQTNLIVGKNTAGKTKIVRAIYALSKLVLEGSLLSFQYNSHEWRLLFNIDIPEEKAEYILKISRGLVTKEKLIVGSNGDKLLLDRDSLGKSIIFAKEVCQTIQFQVDKAELAIVKCRNFIQHSFLESLQQWSVSLVFCEFGTLSEKYTTARVPFPVGVLSNKTRFKSSDCVINTFVLGKRKFGDRFVQAIVSDMAKMGYQLLEVGVNVSSSRSLNVVGGDILDDIPLSLYIKESDLIPAIEQGKISQGMFRALSLFIQVNYFLLTKNSSCIVIDDIGTGLDYQRSSSMAKLLMNKVQEGLICQLIMTSNKESIINIVPIEYLSLIEQAPGSARVHNIYNSREKFEEFKFIGLNNFDLFVSGFLLEKR